MRTGDTAHLQSLLSRHPKHGTLIYFKLSSGVYSLKVKRGKSECYQMFAIMPDKKGGTDTRRPILR
jgi:hypothetical protein